MRILADGNIPVPAIYQLRSTGHDVLWAGDAHYLTPDAGLLEAATGSSRLLITYDGDFAELVHRDRQPAPSGILLFRIHRDVPPLVESAFIANAVTAWDAVPPGIWTVQIRHRSA